MRGVDDSLLDGVIYFRFGSEKWRELRGALIDYGLGLHQQPLSALIPNLEAMTSCDFRTRRWIPPGIDPLQNRVRNALLENGIKRASDLAAIKVADVYKLELFGELTVRSLLSFLIEVSISVTLQDQALFQTTALVLSSSEGQRKSDSMPEVPAVQEQTDEDVDKRPHVNFVGSDDLVLLAQWELYKGRGAILGQILNYTPTGYTPPEVEEAALKLLSADLSDLVPESPSLIKLIDKMLNILGESDRYVIMRLSLSPNPATLNQIGQELDVSRERIRQINNRAEKLIYKSLSDTSFLPIRWVATELHTRLGDVAPLEHPFTIKTIEELLPGERAPHHLQMLLNLAGYRRSEGWLTKISLHHIEHLFAEAADEFNVIPEGYETEVLTQTNLNPAFHDIIFSSFNRISKRSGRLVLWHGSVVDKAVTVLALRGEPAAMDTIISEIGESYSVVGAKDRLRADPRVMRVNKTEFGLRIWGLEEYSGITEEIRERIERDGGSAELDSLVAEIVSTFGVAESSVRVYCSAPMFTIEDGVIELCLVEDRPKISENIASVKGAYKPSSQEVSILVSIDKDTLRGSGRSLMPTLTAALQVQPGQELIYQGLAGSVRITWPMSSALGGSRGSIRDFALSLNAREGDRMLLVFDIEQKTVRYSLIDESSIRKGPSLEAIAELTGVHAKDAADATRKLALAVEIDQKSLRKALVDRGDVEVVSSLPENIVSDELTHALEELASVFGEI